MKKEKIFKFFLNYIYSVIISFILCFIMFLQDGTVRDSLIISLLISLSIGWLLFGFSTLQIIKGISKDIKEKKYKNLIAWLIAFLIFAPYYLRRIFEK